MDSRPLSGSGLRVGARWPGVKSVGLGDMDPTLNLLVANCATLGKGTYAL